jgi:DegV family protein with EDD domain
MLVVLSAAEAAKAGASFDQVVAVVKDAMTRTQIRMGFDTLEYLRRGGRISKARALLGSVLKLHPVLGLRDGEAFPYGRTRNRAAAVDALVEFAKSFKRIEKMAVEDATTPQEADALCEKLNSLFPKERIYRSKVSPVFGAHVGPHVLGVAVLEARQEAASIPVPAVAKAKLSPSTCSP